MSRDASDGLRIFGIYIATQVPGWFVAAGVLFLVVSQGWLEAGWAVVLWAAVVGKDLVLYPRVRHAFEPARLHGVAALLDREGVVESPLDPDGTVRIGSELWRARARERSDVLPRGQKIRVCEVEGLTLLVEPQ